MFLIVSRVHNLCQNHQIYMTVETKLKNIANRPFACENMTLEPGDYIDIYAFDTYFPYLSPEDLYDMVYHCDFVPISSDSSHQGESKPAKNVIITDNDVLVYESTNFVDENGELEAIRIEGNSLARIWSIWAVRDLGLTLKTYGEKLTSFMKNLLPKQPIDEERKDELRQPLLDSMLVA